MSLAKVPFFVKLNILRLMMTFASFNNALFLSFLRKEEIFGMSTSLHVQMFPYFLYPGNNIAMTASIFMIVAITFER